MSPFEFLSVALSFVIGLGVTYLLTSVLSLFRERRRCRPDWLPLVWAFYVFAWQAQFWWALFELSALETWTLPTFLALLLYSVLLFAAGGLVIPHDVSGQQDGLRAYFERDGKWGVVVLSAYFLVAPLFNATLFGTPASDPLNLSILGLGLLGAVLLFLKRRRAQIVHALVWGVLAARVFVWASLYSY